MATKISYTDLFKNVSEERFGISRKLVNEALAKPSSRFDTVLDSLQIGLYLKRCMDAGESYYLLVATRVPDKVTRHIDLAFIIPDDLVENTDTTKPLEALRTFAHRFGLNLAIGTVTDTFFFQQTVPLVLGAYTREQITRVDNADNHSYALQSYLKLDSTDEDIVARCALAYCIDIDAYVDYLEQRRSVEAGAAAT